MENEKSSKGPKQKGKQDVSNGLEVQKAPKTKQKKKMNAADQQLSQIKSPKANVPQTLKLPKKKQDKNKKLKAAMQKKTPSTSNLSASVFEFNEIANNKEASALFQDLVNCFTKYSLLPQEKLDMLKKSYVKQTMKMFLSVLNDCVNKIFNKILETSSFQELITRNKVQKSVSCQTDISYGNS